MNSKKDCQKNDSLKKNKKKQTISTKLYNFNTTKLIIFSIQANYMIIYLKIFTKFNISIQNSAITYQSFI